MARSSWPDAKVSVILLPSGTQGMAVFELAREWTRMGLLGPALWVHPDQVKRGRNGPPRITASILMVDLENKPLEVQVDLFESLAREMLALVRLVKLRSAAPSRATDAEQDEIADSLDEYLTKSMPMAVPTASAADQATALTRLTLICAPTEFQLQERVNWASSEYGTIVVASPEDRSTPWSGDAFVRDNDRFVGFALMHLASVAGLWTGTGAGSFELVSREPSNNQSLWVSRVFLNAVITEALGRRTAAQVLGQASDPTSLLIDPAAGSPPSGTAYIDDHLVPTYVDQMVAAAMSLDDGALAFHPAPPEQTPERGRIGIGAQLGRFFSFSWDKLIAMPAWAGRWLTSRTARTLTKQLQSEQGTHIVGEDYDAVLDARDVELLRRRDAIFDAEQRAREQMASPVGVSEMRTTPRLWARLRELVFGSLDGSSDLSDLGFTPIEDKVPVFGRVGDVFTHPDDTWSTEEQGPDTMPSRMDWYALAEVDPRDALMQWVQDGLNDAAQATADADAASHAFRLMPEPADVAFERAEQEAAVEDEVAEESADEAHENSPSFDEVVAEEEAEPSVEEQVAEERGPLTDEEIAQMQRQMRVDWEDAQRRAAVTAEAAEEATAESTRRSGVLSDFNDWVVGHDRSFVWRLLARFAADRTSARKTVAQLEREIEWLSIPAPGDLVTLRRSFHKTMLAGWSIIVGIAAVIILLPIVLPHLREQLAQVPLWYPQTWQTVLATVIALVLYTLLRLAAYHRGWSAFQRRVDLTHAHLDYVSTASRTARRELARLSSLHRQAVDWLDLLARAIHRPWQVRESWTSKPDYDVARDALPFAMSVATVVESDHASTTRLRRMTTERLVRRGWRADAFSDLVREVGAELGQDGESFGIAALDDDLPHASNNTRRMLREAMDGENVLVRVAVPRLRDLMGEIQRHTLHGSKPRVTPLDDNPLRPLAQMNDPAWIDDGLAWDDFLIDSLHGRRDPVTPLSTSWLAERQIQEGHHERVRSYLMLPERLERELDFQDDTSVDLIPFPGADRGGIDLVWRSDVVGPLPTSAIGLWDYHRTDRPVELPPTTGDSGV
ncbi:MAG: hypothetical protein QM607_03735 [Microbacterium sp.]